MYSSAYFHITTGYTMSNQVTELLAVQAELLAETAGILSHHNGTPAPAVTTLHQRVHNFADTLTEMPHTAHLAELVHELAEHHAIQNTYMLQGLAVHLKITAQRLTTLAQAELST